jgi:hypothetical protein
VTRPEPSVVDRLDVLEERLWSMYEEIEERLLRHDDKIEVLSSVRNDDDGPTVSLFDLAEANRRVAETSGKVEDLRRWLAGVVEQVQGQGRHIQRLSDIAARSGDDDLKGRVEALAASVRAQAQELERLATEVEALTTPTGRSPGPT